MGLDMYLTAERDLWRSTKSDFELSNKIGELIGLERQSDWTKIAPVVNKVSIEVAYWRKANAIHQWFVDNVQDGEDDCRSYFVDRDQLQTLIDLCESVLANSEQAEDLLPTQSGFFFGSTEYDDWYFHNLENTVKQLKEILENPALKNADFKYSSSW